MSTVLIIDDEVKLSNLLSRIISLEGFEVLECPDGKSAMKTLIMRDIDVVLCDVKLPDVNGVALVKDIKVRYPAIEIILLTAYGNIPDGVKAIQNGAFDYITKGDDQHKILPLLHKALEKAQLQKKIVKLESSLHKKYSFDEVIGSSSVLQSCVQLAKKVAVTDTTVLLNGETGTGKEVFARAIHQESSRNRQAFVAVNCASFSKELLESELFGHKMGAFTGAIKDQKGLFEEAHQGTLFLDELGELPLELQAKLLRVIESGEFLKIGETKPSQVNVRLISATHRNLKEEVAKGNFREDLYYRISVFQIILPALQDRKEDIEAFALHFAQIFAHKIGRKSMQFSKDYLQLLEKHTWKGNLRELKNVIERSVILAEHQTIEIDTLPPEILKNTSNVENLAADIFDLAMVERNHISKMLHYTQGNKTETAKLLNIALTTLYRKIEAYKL